MANLGNDRGFISKEYISIGMRPFGENPKQNHESLCSKLTISYNCGESLFLTRTAKYYAFFFLIIIHECQDTHLD